ncbi:class D sortase [Paenibacillus sp. M1]|uniref:Class D sortase n=1 Tax=Paenibacillus haidiansis TaxID=1574488 RepID=A0ABU7VT87_9BACL
MKKLAYILIVAGIMIILFPKANEWYADLKQKNLLEQAMSNNSPQSAEAFNQKLKREYLNMSQVLSAAESLETTVSLKTTSNANNQEGAIAIIIIPKIDVELPILEGATKSNMKYAAAHLKETAALGEEGNAAIAAHRAHTKGRLFNRLNEVEAGDEIIIEARGSRYVYVVDKISIVEPTDISVLDSEDQSKKVLTLITCDPLINPTHRLIVRGKMQE